MQMNISFVKVLVCFLSLFKSLLVTSCRCGMVEYQINFNSNRYCFVFFGQFDKREIGGHLKMWKIGNNFSNPFLCTIF